MQFWEFPNTLTNQVVLLYIHIVDAFPQSTFSDSNNIMTEGQGYAVIRYHGTAVAQRSESLVHGW